jgi:hypothetical protein
LSLLTWIAHAIQAAHRSTPAAIATVHQGCTRTFRFQPRS